MDIGIIGLGLIGGSYAKALKKNNHNIYGLDIDQNAIDYSLSNNIIDIGSIHAKDILPYCDIVIISLYPSLTIKFVKENMKLFKKNTVISDVAGIKTTLIKSLGNSLRSDLDFVFAHPIAGREKIGIKYSNADIFNNANFVITPTLYNKDTNINKIKKLAIEMGFGNISIITPKEHDEIIGFTSQLTHTIAIALVNSDNEHYNTKYFIGDSYKDLTRIAMINHDLWSELFINNKENLLNEIDRFEKELDKLKDAIKSQDEPTLIKLMKTSTIKRSKIEKGE